MKTYQKLLKVSGLTLERFFANEYIDDRNFWPLEDKEVNANGTK